MPAEFETGIFGMSRPAWHNLGKVVPDLMTTEFAIRESGVGGVITRTEPIWIKVGESYVEVPDYQAVVRTDNDFVLGVHGMDYEREEFADAFMSLGQAFGLDAKIWETMIVLRKGKIAAGVMRFPEFDRTLIDGSHLLTYLAAYTSHDGTYALTYTDTNIRAECANKLRMIDSRVTGRRFAIRHTSGKDARKAEAIRVMSFAQERADAQERLAIELLDKKLSERQMQDILNVVIPVPDEKGRGQTMAQNKQAKILTIMKDAPDLQGVQGTAWSLVQATGAFVDHHATYRNTATSTAAESRFVRTVLTGDTIAEKVLAFAVEA